MLLTKTVNVKWNSRNKKYYTDLGYIFTKMGDDVEIKIDDLSKGSNVRVEIRCDYCHQLYSTQWDTYYRLKQKINCSDCCNSPKCTGQKSKESMLLLHGVDCSIKIPEVKEKIVNTCLKKYGVKNPFANKNVQKKIRDTNLKKYGVEFSLQNYEVREKGKNTCLEKYGVENYGKLYSETHIKEKSPTWKGGVAFHRVERSNYDYRQWRKSVFERDVYTCQCCGCRNGHGKYIRLEAHHISNWKNNVEQRYDVSNGITLCQTCHLLFHSKYGKTNNTKEQLDEFIENCNR